MHKSIRNNTGNNTYILYTGITQRSNFQKDIFKVQSLTNNKFNKSILWLQT